MSVGSLLVALALAVVAGAYVARPFRVAAGLERAVERWVEEARKRIGERAKERDKDKRTR